MAARKAPTRAADDSANAGRAFEHPGRGLEGQATQLPLDQIRVGKRHRKDMGDVAGLAASMGAVGLLHPVVVTPDGKLIAGERRLRAAKQLGWSKIPVNVVDLNKLVLGEFAENTYRKALTPSEAVAIARALEPLEKAAAKELLR